MNKSYLGDGLYAYDDGFGFWLKAENGVRVLHEVYLEPEVLEAFFSFIETTRAMRIKREVEAK